MLRPAAQPKSTGQADDFESRAMPLAIQKCHAPGIKCGTWGSVMTAFLILVLFVGAAWWFGKKKSRPSSPKRLVADSVPEKFIVFDFETTGLRAEQHEIIEIGAIRVNRDGVRHDTFQSFIRSRERVPARIEELTGITDSMLQQDGVPLAEALQDFANFVGDLPMVAFNAKFDKGFLREASRVTGIPFKNKISCALEAARRAWPDRESYKLVDLSRDGGLKINDAHRALGDCQRALIVYVAACQEA
jgi:DNA polymerase III epsilon subunit family exonuclease